jgi:hypothetical protein
MTNLMIAPSFDHSRGRNYWVLVIGKAKGIGTFLGSTCPARLGQEADTDYS